MNFLWWRTARVPTHQPPTPTAEPVMDLEEAQRKADELTRRADTVSGQLHRRLDRNHWGETVAAIAHRR